LAGTLYGEAQFGIYTFCVTLVETAAGLALFGLKRSLFKFMSDSDAGGHPMPQTIANGVALAVTTGLVVTVAIAAGSPFLASLFRLPIAASTLLLLAPAIMLIVVSDILLVVIRFTRQMRFEVLARSVAEPVTLTVVIFVVYHTGYRTQGLAIGYLMSLAVAAGSSALFFTRLFPAGACLRSALSWNEMRRLVHFSGPTAGYELFVALTDKVDVFLVTFFFPAEVVGIYGMARQFSTFTKKIRQGFDRILPPVLSQSAAVGDMTRVRDQLSMVTRWILSVQMLIILFFAFYGRDLLGLLGGSFSAGWLILMLLVSADAINGALGVSDLPFVYLRPRVNLYIGAVLLALSLVTNLWLIRALGPEGAALAVLVTYAVINAARIGANKWLLDLTTVRPNVVKPVLAAIPTASALLLLRRVLTGPPWQSAVVGIPVLIAAYLAGLYLLGLEPEDRFQVRRVLRRR
jgi:O-antigen/teichoic acid export membrane protein